jgi:serine protease Do
MPAVVSVVTTHRPFLDRPREEPQQGMGSGFLIGPDGLVLTNAHVVEGAAEIEIGLGEGRHHQARVIGTDDATDIALLKIEAPGPLPVVRLGNSDRVRIADWVMVLGSPFGLEHSVTIGIVSHRGRNDIAPGGREGYYDFIQTDASINPGNSGGPLLILEGEVIGIATAINATGQGIGFAIPSNMVKEVVSQLRAHGRVVRSWMGVTVKELPTDLAAAIGLPDVDGVLVTEVSPLGPAATAGLQVGDVITRFQGRTVNNANRLRWSIATAGVGRTVGMTVRRGPTHPRSLRVQLAELPEGPQSTPERPYSYDEPGLAREIDP